MITVENIIKRYGSAFTLDIGRLEIKERHTTVLIGPSGCGKTTLLKIIMYLVLPDKGEIKINGEKMDSKSYLRLRRSMGYVIQEGGLFPHFTAEENVALMARKVGLGEEHINNKIDELCMLVGFTRNLLVKYPVQLSGGQRQRVSLMRALMLDPEIILMDEPLGSLDPVIRSKLQAELKDIFSRLNKTVIFVTHDLAEAFIVGNEIVLMNGGRIVQKGSFEQLMKKPESVFVSEFIRSQKPPEDLIKLFSYGN